MPAPTDGSGLPGATVGDGGLRVWQVVLIAVIAIFAREVRKRA
ncbi:hypothetical protein [Methanoculleus sp.]|nr:hypothetical protein [Methanoculleus sp.]